MKEQNPGKMRFWIVALVSSAVALVLYRVPGAAGLFPIGLTQLIRVTAFFTALIVIFEKLLHLKIYTKIFLGLVLGVVVGILLSQNIAEVKPVGDFFIRMIRMIIIPLVFASLLVGASTMHPRKIGRVGIRTLLYYLTYTAVAITIGLLLANIFVPGAGIDEGIKDDLMKSFQGDEETLLEGSAMVNPVETILRIIPTNIFSSLSEGNLLPIIFFALVMGIGLSMIPEKRADPVVAFFHGVNDVMITVVHVVIKIAPYGVFALIAAVVADFGTDILVSLLKYALLTIGGLVLLNFTYPPMVRLLAGMKMSRFLREIWPVQLIAFSTSSSSATLPVTIDTCEKKLGVPGDIASFVLPLGATVNMNGTALYHGVSALFIAQVMGISLGLGEQLMIVLTSTLAAIGTAGAPMAGTLMLVMVLEAVGIPSAGIALILGVERILDMFRTTINITGDASAAVVIAAGEKGRKTPEGA